MKFVAYYRVSTQKQGQSGLGLEAQQQAVSNYCQPVESFTEVESGKSKQRPELAKALAACKRLGATLVVAKLDRLARNVAFVSALMESGVEFVACDNPTANRLTVHILAAVAEDEAQRISERTKAALAAAKARGVKLGNQSNLITTAAPAARAANVAAADRHKADILPVARGLREAGRTLQEIADILTGRGILTRRGKAWSPTAVRRLLA
ncbi:recombinase family protein [Aeoliella mucimassa]|uniref:DNA-invertase hin n=1 Tax=Aeoliella mucimassa TaxID=2527972 RepID=A0A518AMI9_9BACT|nr:recombinase family protein [Aeoliella mucimassa]QDU55916.1 DNA-invertase hin [Aeoliella mucimassa]